MNQHICWEFGTFTPFNYSSFPGSKHEGPTAAATTYGGQIYRRPTGCCLLSFHYPHPAGGTSGVEFAENFPLKFMFPRYLFSMYGNRILIVNFFQKLK